MDECLTALGREGLRGAMLELELQTPAMFSLGNKRVWLTLEPYLDWWELAGIKVGMWLQKERLTYVILKYVDENAETLWFLTHTVGETLELCLMYQWDQDPLVLDPSPIPRDVWICTIGVRGEISLVSGWCNSSLPVPVQVRQINEGQVYING